MNIFRLFFILTKFSTNEAKSEDPFLAFLRNAKTMKVNFSSLLNEISFAILIIMFIIYEVFFLIIYKGMSLDELEEVADFLHNYKPKVLHAQLYDWFMLLSEKPTESAFMKT